MPKPKKPASTLSSTMRPRPKEDVWEIVDFEGDSLSSALSSVSIASQPALDPDPISSVHLIGKAENIETKNLGSEQDEIEETKKHVALLFMGAHAMIFQRVGCVKVWKHDCIR